MKRDGFKDMGLLLILLDLRYVCAYIFMLTYKEFGCTHTIIHTQGHTHTHSQVLDSVVTGVRSIIP